MARITGVDIPDAKRLEVALTYLYGVGPTRAKQLLAKTGLDPDKRAKQLTGEEIQQLSKALATYVTEGSLRKQVRDNIARLERIGSYRGKRHAVGLPTRGQRTRTNARTKRGRRMTVGAMKKEDMAKLEQAKKVTK